MQKSNAKAGLDVGEWVASFAVVHHGGNHFIASHFVLSNAQQEQDLIIVTKAFQALFFCALPKGFHARQLAAKVPIFHAPDGSLDDFKTIVISKTPKRCV